jgi:hypothetical protein
VNSTIARQTLVVVERVMVASLGVLSRLSLRIVVEKRVRWSTYDGSILRGGEGGSVLRIVIRQSMMPVLAGCVVGAACALIVGSLVRSRLYGVDRLVSSHELSQCEF